MCFCLFPKGVVDKLADKQAVVNVARSILNRPHFKNVLYLLNASVMMRRKNNC